MSLQVHAVRTANTPSASVTNYLAALNGQYWDATAHRGTAICTAAGTFSNFSVVLPTAPGASKSLTFTLMVNGVASAAAVAISGIATSGTYTATAIALADGDELAIRCVPSGTPAVSAPSICWDFTSTTSAQSIYGMGNTKGPIALNRVNRVLCGVDITNWAAGGAVDVVGCAGTITKLTIKLDVDVGASGSVTFTITKNGTAQDGTGGTPDTRITFATGTTKASATVSLSVAQGDQLQWSAVRTGSPASVRPITGVRFVATTAGESHYGSAGQLNVVNTDGAVYFSPFQGRDTGTGSATESARVVTLGVTGLTLRNLYAAVNAAMTGGALTVILRKNGGSGGQTATIADGVLTGTVTATTTYAAGDTVAIETSSTSATARPPSWAFVQDQTALELTTVPNVVGLTEAAADTALLAAGLITGTVTTASSPTVPAGDVISQSPTAGSVVAIGSDVDLVVSTGPALTTVPNVVGLTTAAADAALVAVGLVTGTLTTATHPSAPAGTVISQSPTAGSAVAPGSAVALVISLGPLDQSIKPAAIVEVELDGVDAGWTALTTDVLRAPGIVIRRGIDETRPDARVASTGTASFGLNNSASNSVGLLGYYSPHHVNLRDGFGLGIRCRVSLQSPDLVWRVQFLGRLDAIDPLPGAHGARQVLVTAVDWLDEAARWRLTPAIGEQIDQSWDAVLTAILAQMPVQPAAISLNGGSETWPYALDTSEVSQQTALAEFVKLAHSEYGLIYQRADGTLRAEDRHFRMTTTAAVWTLTDAEFQDLELPSTRDDLLNTVRVTTHPRTVSPVANVTVYEQANTIELAAGETKMLMGSYRDPLTGDAIGATEIQPQVPGFDLEANAAADGSGADVTASLGVVITAGQSGVRFDVTNGSGAPAFLTTLRLIGKAIYDHGATVHEATDAASISLHGEHALDYDMPYQGRQDVGQAAADYILAKYKDPLAQAHSLTVIARTPELLLQILTRDISDRITLSETVTGADDTYFINAVELTIHTAGHASARYTLTPADDPATMAGYFILDISALDGPDILAPF